MQVEKFHSGRKSVCTAKNDVGRPPVRFRSVNRAQDKTSSCQKLLFNSFNVLVGHTMKIHTFRMMMCLKMKWVSNTLQNNAWIQNEAKASSGIGWIDDQFILPSQHEHDAWCQQHGRCLLKISRETVLKRTKREKPLCLKWLSRNDSTGLVCSPN